ncbi:hypothetical protein [Variovorax guangxiensis]|uniref:hypothetical protein n=1 Tax=Variovorax guangxiensis TaxID=1775474 RepID=UPI00286308B3|nr:hypothetical protein [Variovorax guangxiensis]
MASYLPYEPQQQMLLPEALQDWLPEGHLACFISDAVDGLDLSALHERYAGGGPRNQPMFSLVKGAKGIAVPASLSLRRSAAEDGSRSAAFA